MASIILSNGQWVTPDQLAELAGRAAARRFVAVDDLAARLDDLRAEWAAAAGGNLQAVTVDLGMLFDDLASLFSGESNER